MVDLVTRTGDRRRQPDALTELAAGIATMARVLGQTLGPTGRPVLNAIGRGTPELLTDSGTIARRLNALPSRRENIGAMMLREMAMSMRRQHGDGTATAAVLADAMVRQAARLVAAGADAVATRRGVEYGVEVATNALAEQARAVSGVKDLAALAVAASHDSEIGDVLAEMFDLLGEHAALIVEDRVVPGLDRSYIDGACWRVRPAIRGLVPKNATELSLRDPLVLAVDQTLDAEADVAAVLELAAAERRPLLLVARDITGAAKELLGRYHAGSDAAPRAVVGAVRLAGAPHRMPDDLADIALLTGGEVVGTVLGRSPRRVRSAWCGTARQAALSKARLILTGGSGDAEAIATHTRALEARSATLQRGTEEWEKIRMRIGRLTGSTGVIGVGGTSPAERDLRREHVTKAQRVLEMAGAGVVPGGGVAFLQCVPAVLDARARCATSDERWGLDVVAAALEAPFRQLVANHAGPAGNPRPEVALAHVRELEPGWGFDIRTESFAAMDAGGVLDSVGVLAGALHAAGSLAATAISTTRIVGGVGGGGR